MVAKKSIVSLVGANGAGKSTLVRTISGLERPLSGEIWFKGKRIDHLPAHKIVGLGIAHVPEGRRLFQDMSVLENLRMGAYSRLNQGGLLHKNLELNQDISMVYQHFPRLEERSAQRAGSLSGGEQQMVSIARALMNRPELLILDEPLIGLAPAMVSEIAKIIKDINIGQGVSILLVEQNARLAFRLAQTGYVLKVGEVAIAGTTQELANDPEVKRVYLS